MTLIRIFEELRALGYEGGYDAVRRYTRAWSKARGYAVTRERIVAGESVYRISGAPAGSGDRVVQTEAVDGRRDHKRKTKRAA